MMRYVTSGLIGVGVLIGLSILFGSWYTIDQGERGVILRYGAIASTAEPGLGFKLPMIDSVVRISVQSKAVVYDKMEAYSRDQQPADIKLSVNYRIPADRVQDVYSNYGGEDGLLSRLGQPFDYAVQLEVPTDLLVERIAGRAAAEGRADDNPESVRKRLDVYDSQTAPVIEFYRQHGQLTVVDGVGTLDEVFTRILEAVAPVREVG